MSKKMMMIVLFCLLTIFTVNMATKTGCPKCERIAGGTDEKVMLNIITRMVLKDGMLKCPSCGYQSQQSIEKKRSLERAFAIFFLGTMGILLVTGFVWVVDIKLK